MAPCKMAHLVFSSLKSLPWESLFELCHIFHNGTFLLGILSIYSVDDGLHLVELTDEC